MRSVAWSVLPIACLLLLGVGCTTTDGQPLRAQSSTAASETTTTQTPIRQTDAEGRPLPFRTEFPNRWNANNDGTKYEPCTAVSLEVLTENGIRPDTVRDAAASDSQTLRGCEWSLAEGQSSRAHQFVGNLDDPEDGIAGYKKANNYGVWLPDIVISGRAVAVSSLDGVRCEAFVQSGSAIVSTGLDINVVDGPPVNEICNRAVEFLRDTIGGIPR